MYRIQFLIIFFLCQSVIKLNCILIPSIGDVFLKPIGFSNVNLTVRFNSTCERCLCEFFNNPSNYQAFNCFNNETCEFFSTIPLSYRLKQSSNTRFYYRSNISLHSKLCCVPNMTELLLRLQNITPNQMNLTFQPSAFGYDENITDEAAVIGANQASIYWFNPFNLTFQRNASVWTMMTLALHNNLVLIAKDYTPTIYLLNREGNQLLRNVTHGSLLRTRKYIFLNNSQTMIASAQTSNAVAVFNTVHDTNYTLQQLIPYPFPSVHGLAKVNDTLFYASTWTNKRIGICQYENQTWSCRSFVNATGSGSGSHLTVDECGRIWYVLPTFGLRIYDSSGLEIANWNMSLGGTNQIYDILLLPNYILIISFQHAQKLVQYDPQLSCT